ncbi:rRNA pseudouridine synthase [bacterium]|jgi:23S rRNA pseudouridine2605 synthase|nr:rRNA pseudouridine synthase [bacterium]
MKTMTLSAFLSRAGLCARRKSVELIKVGRISVGGKIIDDPAFRVPEGDQVEFDGKPIKAAELVYIAMNKPPRCVTTASDDLGRRTVLDFLGCDCKIRVYPVGRLDADTRGILLLTNDGDLALKLTHPKFHAPKKYHVTLRDPLTQEIFERVRRGARLSDGLVKVDRAAILDPTRKKVEITLHSGKNRVVRRLFLQFGIKTAKLERIEFAGIASKGLPSGAWRMLRESEVRALKKLVATNS